MLPAFFRKFPLFADLDDRELTAIAAVAKSRRYGKDDVIFYADESGDIFCLIREGQVKVTMISPEGKEIILKLLGPGDFFGEMALLDDEPRSATVIAAERSRLLVLSRAAFQEHIAAHPRTASRVLRELTRRLRRADAVIGNLALLDVYGRLAGKLRELAAADGEEREDGILIRQRPTQAEIAAMIGTSRETVSRALSELARRGFLEMSGKRLLLRRAFLSEEARAAAL